MNKAENGTYRPVAVMPAAMAPLLPGGEPVESLLRKAQYFLPGTASADHAK